MWFNLLFVIFVVATCLNYIFLDIKVDKLKKESLDKDKVIDSLMAHNKALCKDSLMAHNKALCKLNTGFKDHERRINDIESLLLSEKPEEPKEPEKPNYTCNDCKYYHALSGIGFANAISFGFSNSANHYFKCEKIGCTYPIECNVTCHRFEKKEGLDNDENSFYADNVKVDIPSKAYVYTTNGLLTSEELVDRISRLFLDGAIGVATMNELLERLKQ